MNYTPRGGVTSIECPKPCWRGKPIQQRGGTGRQVQTLAVAADEDDGKLEYLH
jgi:hypothetical protein